MSVELHSDAGVTQVRLSNQVDLSEAAELKAVLLELLAPPAAVLKVDASDVSELHVSVVQLLWAAAREAHARNIAFQILHPEDRGVHDALIDLGVVLPQSSESAREPVA